MIWGDYQIVRMNRMEKSYASKQESHLMNLAISPNHGSDKNYGCNSARSTNVRGVPKCVPLKVDSNL